jgi:hypothetical protein
MEDSLLPFARSPVRREPGARDACRSRRRLTAGTEGTPPLSTVMSAAGTGSTPSSAVMSAERTTAAFRGGSHRRRTMAYALRPRYRICLAACGRTISALMNSAHALKCGGHDIPAAINSPGHRQGHDLPLGLKGPGRGSAHLPAAAGTESARRPTRLALIRKGGLGGNLEPGRDFPGPGGFRVSPQLFRIVPPPSVCAKWSWSDPDLAHLSC